MPRIGRTSGQPAPPGHFSDATAQQADELDRYQGFNISMQERGEIAMEMVQAQLDNGGQERARCKADGTAIKACLIQGLPDSRPA